jgi:hypothetical protein
MDRTSEFLVSVQAQGVSPIIGRVFTATAPFMIQAVSLVHFLPLDAFVEQVFHLGDEDRQI